MINFIRLLFLFSFVIFGQVFLMANEEDKTVLLAILARDKGHCLPMYLKCIEKLDYKKELISIYVNTNNNQDDTQEILEKWIEKHKENYREIIYESHELQNFNHPRPHQWNSYLFSVLGTIRNKSLQVAVEKECDFYFIVDCDNFIQPYSLKDLVEKDKPIIAPMLVTFPNTNRPNSNFYSRVDKRGHRKSSPNFMKIKLRKKLGTFKVPLVHCTYLIKTEYLDRLGYIDNSDTFEFIIFSRMARENEIDQYICNEKDYGRFLYSAKGKRTLKEEQALMKEFFQRPDFEEIMGFKLDFFREENLFSPTIP